MSAVRKGKASNSYIHEDSSGMLDLLSMPLVQESGDGGEDTDDAIDSPAEVEQEPRQGNRARQQHCGSLAGAATGSFLRAQQQKRRSSTGLRAPWITPSIPRYQDYRSEGEQPSTERNGNRRELKNESRQDSFRLSRMPKRGGRKRLRRIHSVRRKIRVSSYCVSRELRTLQLLHWLEKQPNRRLSQSIRAEGGSVPHGPVGAATVTTSAEEVAAQRLAVDGDWSRGGRNYRSEALTIDHLEWMDSLYIDVIHSTTDIRGGIRKARALARRSWEDIPLEEENGKDGEGEEEDDDVVTHKDVIYFPYGAVVFWGFSEAEEKEILSSLTKFMVEPVSETELAESFDDMTFVYRHRRARKSVPLKNDEITLDTRDPAEKLAYSCALAQSAKLFVFEERLNNTVESTSKYPQMLAATGKIPLTEVQIGRLVGQVLCEQNEVNLHSDILDTPEYFWEEDAWEPAYEALTAYLDMPLRVDNLNKRLSILKELLDVLSAQSTNAHATRLEMIIVYLIFVEVAIELVWNVIIKDIFRLVGDNLRDC